MNSQQLQERTKQFAISIFKFIDKAPKSKAMDVISYQILKASSSVAANYRAVCRAKSEADFFNKLKIVVEEADESLFWLEFIDALDIYKDKSGLHILINEANEIVSIFTASIKTINLKKIKS